MTCPICNHVTRVNGTLDQHDHIIRYRKCKTCGYAFQTIETDEDIYARLNKPTKKSEETHHD